MKTTFHFGCINSRWYLCLTDKSRPHDSMIFMSEIPGNESTEDQAKRIHEEAKHQGCLDTLLNSETYAGADAPARILAAVRVVENGITV